MRESIPIETRITMALAQLNSKNSLQMCREVYGVIESTTLIIAKKLYLTIIKHLKPLVIPKLTRNKMKEITIDFESLHGILYILNAINDNHIPIMHYNSNCFDMD